MGVHIIWPLSGGGGSYKSFAGLAFLNDTLPREQSPHIPHFFFYFRINSTLFCSFIFVISNLRVSIISRTALAFVGPNPLAKFLMINN